MQHAISLVKALCLCIIPFGFIWVSDVFQTDFWYALILTVIATGCVWTTLYVIKPSELKFPYLYIFLALYITGYFLKLFILAYFTQNELVFWEYIDVYYRLERRILEDYRTITACYEIATIGLVAFTLSAGLMTVLGADSATQVSLRFNQPDWQLSNNKIRLILLATVALFLVLLGIQVWLGLNFVSGDERQTVVLPFRLAGIILTLYKYVIPLLFASLLWLTDRPGSRYWRWVLVFFIAYGVLSGMHSTSKAYFATVILVLGMLWVVTHSLNWQRVVLLTGLTLFMLPFNSFLGVNRVLRVLRDDFSVIDVVQLSASVLFDSRTSQEFAGIFHSDQTKTLTELLGPLMRVNGADTLMNVVNYGPTFSLSRLSYYFSEAGLPVNTEYATKVLGLPLESGLAFSPSLMGYFYYLLADPILCGIAVLIFLLSWGAIFNMLRKSRLKLKSVLTALLLMSFAQYVSEGTLESMPMNVLLVLTCGLILEVGVNYVGLRNKNIPRLKSKLAT